MQKCKKCYREFCSPINYRRHLRVHLRSLNVNKDTKKNRDLLAAFWDKISPEQAKKFVSFEDLMLKEIPGSSFIDALASAVHKPGMGDLPPLYMEAANALLGIIRAIPSRSPPISSQELFSILDNASESTFLCAGTADFVQKYVFDDETSENCLELKNVVACTSFLFELQLVEVWIADRDAEAYTCQLLLVKEEKAAQKRQAALLEKKRQNKLRKEQKLKELYELLHANDDVVEGAASTEASVPSSLSDTEEPQEEDIEAQLDILKERIEQMNERERKLDEKSKEMYAHLKQLNEKENKIEELDITLIEQNAKVRELEAHVHALNMLIDSNTLDSDTLLAECEQHTEQIQEKDNKIVGLQNQLDIAQETIISKGIEASHLIEQYAQFYQGQSKEIERLRSQLGLQHEMSDAREKSGTHPNTETSRGNTLTQTDQVQGVTVDPWSLYGTPNYHVTSFLEHQQGIQHQPHVAQPHFQLLPPMSLMQNWQGEHQVIHESYLDSEAWTREGQEVHDSMHKSHGNAEPQILQQISSTGQRTDAEKSQQSSLMDERALLLSIARTIGSGGRIKISSTLSNRLGRLIDPLHWYDYEGKHGKLDDFLASHPDLFLIDGNYIQLREGAQATIAATAAVAKVTVIGPSSYSSGMPYVSLTPMAQSRRLKKVSSLEPSSTVHNKNLDGGNGLDIKLSISKDQVESDVSETRSGIRTNSDMIAFSQNKGGSCGRPVGK